MVFQKPNPFPKSIYDNVAYGPKIHGLSRSKRDLDEIVESSLRKAGLFEEVKDRLQESGTGLSGGQQQRLCIARAIAVSPEVILMDEPCSALDPIATAKVEELIDELRANYTIIIVTHSMQQAARVSQKTAFFHLGDARRDRRDRADLHQSAGQADPGLHHRPLRLRSDRQMVMKEHIVASFDEELSELSQKIAEMGGIAEQQLADSVAALARRDGHLAQTVIDIDKRMDQLQREVEDRATLMIARRQPMAQDLREIVAAMHIANDLERVGDLAKNTAKRFFAIDNNFGSQRLVAGVEHIAELTSGAAQERARLLYRARPRRAPIRCGSATTRSTRCTPRCSASCSPT